MQKTSILEDNNTLFASKKKILNIYLIILMSPL